MHIDHKNALTNIPHIFFYVDKISCVFMNESCLYLKNFQIKSAELVNCSNNASNVMKQYDNQNNRHHSSTVEKGNRYRSYYTPLSTIEEKTKSPCKKN